MRLPAIPLIEEMQTMRPSPRARMASFARQTQWKVPSRLTDRMRRQSSSGMSPSSWNDAAPALVTSRSTGPRAASTASNMAEVASHEATSAWKTAPSPPAAPIRSSVSAAASALSA